MKRLTLPSQAQNLLAAAQCDLDQDFLRGHLLDQAERVFFVEDVRTVADAGRVSRLDGLPHMGTECLRRHEPLGQLTRMQREDRKSTRLNSSHLGISYAVFCLK